MKKLLAGLALSAVLAAGAVAVATPASAAGVYINLGGHHHGWHRGWHHHYWHHHYWHHHH
jgi:Spy/CpxP family protein refolding chaperone